MIAIDRGIPVWLCDVCRFLISPPGIVVHGQPSARGHLPHVWLCCGDACAAVAESQLASGVCRLEWSHLIEALALQEAR